MLDQKSANLNLVDIPDKLYFSIGEVGELFDLKPHVLRYWEQEFSQIKPVKRNGRRYYQQQDLLLVQKIKNLLYKQGYTVSGARQSLSSSTENNQNSAYKDMLRQTIIALEELQVSLK